MEIFMGCVSFREGKDAAEMVIIFCACVSHRSWGFGVVLDMKWASDWNESVVEAAEQAAKQKKKQQQQWKWIVSSQQGRLEVLVGAHQKGESRPPDFREIGCFNQFAILIIHLDLLVWCWEKAKK